MMMTQVIFVLTTGSTMEKVYSERTNKDRSVRRFVWSDSKHHDSLEAYLFLKLQREVGTGA